MAIVRWYLFSKVLEMHTSLTLTLPEPDRMPENCPVMYLLHGGGENSTTWLRETNIEDISNEYQIASVSIDAESSAYSDMRHGKRYFTYLTEELPEILKAKTSFSARKEDTYIAGFSMGGQGALKAAFRRPDLYSACMALSGARDTIPMFRKWTAMPGGPDLTGVEDALGPIDQLRGSENDIVWLAEKAAKTGRYPRMYLSCGNEDYAVELSDSYHEHLQEIGLKHQYFKAPGIHCYQFGETALRWALDDLTGRRRCS